MTRTHNLGRSKKELFKVVFNRPKLFVKFPKMN